MTTISQTRKYRGKLKGLTDKLGLKKQCPPGYILRAPFKRKYTSTIKESGFNVHRGNKTVRVYPKGSSVLVKASCIKDRGLPGKGPRLIGPLKKGELTRYGYNAHLSSEERQKALKKAISVYGALGVFHKLDAITKLTKRTAPDAHKIFKTDLDWVRKHFTLKKR
jgi:hypothetical protein